MPNITSERALEKVIFCTVEGTYGTDAAPAGANALLTEDWKLDPAKVDKVSRNIDRAGLGGTPDSHGAFSSDVSFKVPITGSGALGTLPTFSSILRACQFNAVIDAGVSVTHNLVSGDMESASLYYYKEERLRKLLGFRGSCGFSFKNGEIPYFMVEGQSLYSPAADGQVVPAPDYTGTQTPLPITYGNTSVFTFGGTDLVLLNYEVSSPSNTKHRDAPNQKEVRISGRRNYTSKAVVAQRLLADFDPESLLAADALNPLIIQHGTTVGNIVNLASPAVQIVGVSEGEEDGDATWELDLNHTATGAGDDDFVLTLT